jgi:hypothetical protein
MSSDNLFEDIFKVNNQKYKQVAQSLRCSFLLDNERKNKSQSKSPVREKFIFYFSFFLKKKGE